MTNIIKYYLQIIIYSITVLIAFLSLIISFFGIILYFITGFKFDILIGTIGWFIITLFLSYFIKRYHNLWDEYYEKRKIETPEIPINFGSGFKAFLYIILFLFLYHYFQGFLGPFPEVITKDIAIEILKLISQINGVLIGFLGVAVSQIYKNNIKRLNHYVILFTFISFIISILYCLTNMTKLNDTIYTKDIIGLPLTFLLCGICIFTLFILDINYNRQDLKSNSN